MSSSPEDRQREAEQAARDLALGRRAQQILSGDGSVVLRRWVAATIRPVASRMRDACVLLEQGKHTEFAAALASPVFGMVEIGGNVGDLLILGRWGRIGKSPGRAATGETTHMEDMVLTVLGTVIHLLMSKSGKVSLSTALMRSAVALRECCVGQFITEVQGAKAMQRIRARGVKGRRWRASADLAQVARLMAGQVQTRLEDGVELDDGRAVVWVTLDGVERRIDLRLPEREDWALIELCTKHIGEADYKVQAFLAFATMILCVTQSEFGWFDIASDTRGRRGHRHKVKVLQFSDEAQRLLEDDLLKWAQCGFVHEPMRVPAIDGDYLTVKHRAVSSKPGPKGWVSKAEGTWQWEAVTKLGEVAWTVNKAYLRSLKASESAAHGQSKSSNTPLDMEASKQSIIGAYSRLATEPALFMPVFMDFRGRAYLRPHQVTYQGSDLQKALLVMPEKPRHGEHITKASIMHLSNLAGLGKRDWRDRKDWFNSGQWAKWDEPDEPHQYAAWIQWMQKPDANYTPCVQLDGTCNGLQHLSALFRDPVSAEAVNITASDDSQPPSDIYGRVAKQVQTILYKRRDEAPWIDRVIKHTKINRDLVKRSVMTLPYGATRFSVREFIHDKAASVADEATANAYRTGWCGVDGISPYPDWVAGKYAAFKDRSLKDHPLFRLDMDRLGDLVWAAIEETLPLPIRAMESWRKIGAWVGDRILGWSPHELDRSGVGLARAPSLHVIQARSKASLRSLSMKGLHLPDSARQVAAVWGRNEIDKTYQRSGIVANYIHSRDATHLALTVHDCLQGRGLPTYTPLGTIHDCFLTMPRHADQLGKILRHTWVELYEDDPLNTISVALYDPDNKGKDALVWAGSWRQAAIEAGLPFPDRGEYEVKDILRSAWAFS